MTPASSTSQPTLIHHRPLASMSCAQGVLDRDKDGILALIEDGHLRAFNIGAELHWRSAVRIMAVDLQRVQRGEPKPTEDFAATLATIFPQAPKPRAGVIGTLKTATVARRLNVRSCHIYNLVEHGWLAIAPGHKARRGPTGSPPMVFDSVAKFLRQRRIT